MKDATPFSAERDEALGAILRDHLTGPNPEHFLARLKTEIRSGILSRPDDSLMVLDRWAKPGILAAGIAAAFLLWFGSTGLRSETTQRLAVAPVSEVLSGGSGSGELLLATVLEGR